MQPKDCKVKGKVQTIYERIEKGEVLGSTVGTVDSTLVLRKGIQEVLDINIVDVEGQAISGETQTPDTAQKLIRTTLECDAFIIIVKAPKDDIEQREIRKHISQSISFLVSALDKKIATVTLLINQIDNLPIAEGVKNKFDEAIEELEEKYSNNPRGLASARESQLGEMTHNYVDPIVNSKHCHAIITQFFRQLQGKQIPNKVFVTTSCGFDNKPPTSIFPSSNNTHEKYTLNPYGTTAAFLWTIYASLNDKKVKKAQNNENSEIISESLLKDIQTIYSSGRAYFNNDSNEKIWHLRNISCLYDSQEWEQK